MSSVPLLSRVAQTLSHDDPDAHFRRQNSTMSMLGSCFILFDVWKQVRNDGFSIFNQLISAISVCDLFFSLGFILATVPLPPNNEFGEDNGIKGANGSDATCKLQGFMIQFGLTGVFYQISLSTYYLLVIYFGWSERRVVKVARYLHLPLVVGLLLALAGLPLYENCFWVCYIPPKPLADSAKNIIIFSHLPIGLAVGVTSVNMVAVYAKVRRQFAASRQWRMSHRIRVGGEGDALAVDSAQSAPKGIFQRRWECIRASWEQRSSLNGSGQPQPPNTRISMEQELFWQCLFYLGAFYISFTFLLLSQLEKQRFNKPLWVFIMIFAPLQGFWNFSTYFRPKVARYYQAWRLQRWQRANEKRCESTSTTGNRTSCVTATHANSGRTRDVVGVRDVEDDQPSGRDNT